MTSRIGEFVIDCHDPQGTAQFWCSALGYRVTDRDETGSQLMQRVAGRVLRADNVIRQPSTTAHLVKD